MRASSVRHMPARHPVTCREDKPMEIYALPSVQPSFQNHPRDKYFRCSNLSRQKPHLYLCTSLLLLRVISSDPITYGQWLQVKKITRYLNFSKSERLYSFPSVEGSLKSGAFSPGCNVKAILNLFYLTNNIKMQNVLTVC